MKTLIVALRHPLVAFFALGLLGFVLAFWLITLGHAPSGRHETLLDRFGQEAQTTIVALIIAALILPALVIVVLRKTFAAVFATARDSAQTGRAPVLPFVTETIEQMRTQLRDLEGKGVVLEPYEVANWVRRCFQTAGATRYVGTDSHIPSAYEEVYTDYLQAHSEFLQHSRDEAGHARFMLVDLEELRTDKFEAAESYQRFVEWHSKNRVRLARLDPWRNRDHFHSSDDGRDLIDTDIGFWEGKYVLLFKPIRRRGERERIRLRIRYSGDQLYEQCEAYVKWLDDVAEDVGDDLPFYSDTLSAGWERFCDASERQRHTIPFIERVIEQIPRDTESIRIFDAATGIGIETTELIHRGYFVAANEIENSLRSAAAAFARQHNVLLPLARFSRTDWLHLDEEHDAAAYDLVLVLGNSLCHLEGKDQLHGAVKQFGRLLRGGGALICDERNFDYIMAHWKEIEADPWNAFRFNKRSPGERVMYHGTDVLGAPVEQTDKGRVVFAYTEVARDGDGRVTPTKGGEIGTLSMYPFEKGAMLEALRDAGRFERVDMFADLEPSDDLRDDADFFTYVAWKKDEVRPSSSESPLSGAQAGS